MNSLPCARIAIRRSPVVRPSPHIRLAFRRAQISTSIPRTFPRKARASYSDISNDGDSREPLFPLSAEQKAAEAQQRARTSRSMKRLGTAVAICVLAQVAIIQFWPLPGAEKTDAGNEQANAEFQGRPIVVAPGGTKLIAQATTSAGEDIELVPTGTTSIPHFPKTIYLPSPHDASASTRDTPPSEAEYTLLGLGVRHVTLFSFEVYVIGIYVQTASLQKLQAKLIHTINPIASSLIPDEKALLQKNLLDGEESYKLWNAVLGETSGITAAFRIVPTRPTDFNHLRDGLVRSITVRTQDASRRARETSAKTGVQVQSDFADDSFGKTMADFKALFSAKGKAPKGSVLLFTRDPKGALTLMYQRDPVAAAAAAAAATTQISNKSPEKREVGEFGVEQFGTVQDERLSRLLWLTYLGGQTVSSEPARKSVAEGIMELVERPIGTVETQIV